MTALTDSARRHQAAIDAGVDPAALVEPMNFAQAERHATEAELAHLVRAEKYVRAGQQPSARDRPRFGMIAAHARSFRLPRRHPRLRRTAAITDDQPREGHRD